MRTPIILMAATVVALALATITALAESTTAEQAEPNVEDIIEVETEVLSEDPEIRLDVKVPEMDIDTSNLWRRNDDRSLVERLSIGVLRSRKLSESSGGGFNWQRCGVKLQEEELVYNAAYWSAHFLVALEVVKDETGVELPVWGAFATMANEGGFNECSLNLEARRWAAENKVVGKFQLTYDRETVWRIVNHPKFAKGKVTLTNKKTGQKKTVAMRNAFDGGVWQIRKSMRTLTREEFDDLTSVVPGIYIGAREMADRALSFSARYRVKGPFPRPWMLWPGPNPYSPLALTYDDRIMMVARWLGATRDEIRPVNIVIDTKNKRKRVYKEKKR